MQKMHGISEIRTKKARDEIRAHKKTCFLSSVRIISRQLQAGLLT